MGKQMKEINDIDEMDEESIMLALSEGEMVHINLNKDSVEKSRKMKQEIMDSVEAYDDSELTDELETVKRIPQTVPNLVKMYNFDTEKAVKEIEKLFNAIKNHPNNQPE